MKKLTLIFVSLAFTACSTTQSNSPQASAQLGTVTQKETIISQTTHRGSPIDIGVGLGGGGHIGWGLSLGLGQLLGLGQRTTTETIYQYRIKMDANESLVMQNTQDVAVGSCLTVLKLANDRNYPKIEANPACYLPPRQ